MTLARCGIPARMRCQAALARARGTVIDTICMSFLANVHLVLLNWMPPGKRDPRPRTVAVEWLGSSAQDHETTSLENKSVPLSEIFIAVYGLLRHD